MKRSLLALAVLGAFAGTASAQSSVTIYGLLDLSIAKNSCAPGCATNPGTPGNEAWTMQQSAASRLGFRGNEDLGGGLSAQFQIEHRFTPDNGAIDASGIMWYGRSYVQLTSAAAGSVYLGREYDPSFWISVKSDPFGWDGVGQIGTMQNALFAAQNSGSSVRTNNTVGYKTPNLGGLTANVAVGLGEGAGPRQTGFNVEYAAGPLYAGLGYERLAEGGAALDGNNLVNMAVHYDFGVAKLIGFYSRGKTNGGNNTNKTVLIGATAPIGGGKLKAAYARLDPEGNNNNRTKFGLGYDYPLSKRTNVYFDIGLAKQDTLDNSNAYAFGMKHTF
ncbi:MAG: porin [Piscinibacter sp.]|nr:porin [Piscinibacter sp.]